MELIQLNSFYEIVKTGSFSEASKKVYRSQSAVSHQIKNLEKELNVKLFERLGKTVKLTEEGKILLNIISKFSDGLGNLKRIYADMQNGNFGKLDIVASSAVMTYVLPRILKKFMVQFPNITFKLVTCNIISEIQSMVLEGEVDFGIGIRPDQIIPKNLDFLFWRSLDTLLITSKNHPLSLKKTIKLSDISKYPHILYRKAAVIRKVIEDVFSKNKLSYNIIMEMDTAENIKSYVEMGIGVGILSSITITSKDKDRLAIFNVNKLFGKLDVGIYYRKDKYISTAMKQFVKLFAPELVGRFAS
jgi:LysR family cys regulon transcriptional activator